MGNGTGNMSQGSPQGGPINMGNILACEARRRLSPVSFSNSQLRTLDLPRDTVVKRAEIYLNGVFTTGYSSGSPVFSERGIFQRICPRIDVVIDGQRTVKSIDPYMQRYMNNIYSGNYPIRRYDQPGASVTSLLGDTDWVAGTVAYPTDTQYQVIEEALTIHFECPLSYAYDQRFATLLNIKDVSSAEMRFTMADISNVQSNSTSATVTYAAVDLSFAVTLIENRAIPRDAQFFDFKETVKRVSYTAEVRESLVDLNRGNGLAGLALMAIDGDTGRTLRDRAIRDLGLIVNGQQIIQRTTFNELQKSNASRFGLNDTMISAGQHPARGMAFMNLINGGRIDSALNTSIGAGVDQVQLQVSTGSTAAPDAVTYTNSLELSVLQQEIASVPVKA